MSNIVLQDYILHVYFPRMYEKKYILCILMEFVNILITFKRSQIKTINNIAKQISIINWFENKELFVKSKADSVISEKLSPESKRYKLPTPSNAL